MGGIGCHTLALFMPGVSVFVSVFVCARARARASMFVTTKRTHWRGHNKKYVLIPEVNILGRKNTKRTQRRGRNVWAWVG
jgi:hypothetical protein